MFAVGVEDPVRGAATGGWNGNGPRPTPGQNIEVVAHHRQRRGLRLGI